MFWNHPSESAGALSTTFRFSLTKGWSIETLVELAALPPIVNGTVVPLILWMDAGELLGFAGSIGFSMPEQLYKVCDPKDALGWRLRELKERGYEIHLAVDFLGQQAGEPDQKKRAEARQGLQRLPTAFKQIVEFFIEQQPHIDAFWIAPNYARASRHQNIGLARVSTASPGVYFPTPRNVLDAESYPQMFDFYSRYGSGAVAGNNGGPARVLMLPSDVSGFGIEAAFRCLEARFSPEECSSTRIVCAPGDVPPDHAASQVITALACPFPRVAPVLSAPRKIVREVLERNAYFLSTGLPVAVGPQQPNLNYGRDFMAVAIKVEGGYEHVMLEEQQLAPDVDKKVMDTLGEVRVHKQWISVASAWERRTCTACKKPVLREMMDGRKKKLQPRWLAACGHPQTTEQKNGADQAETPPSHEAGAKAHPGNQLFNPGGDAPDGGSAGNPADEEC